jgi:lysine 2,3-aminomutase
MTNTRYITHLNQINELDRFLSSEEKKRLEGVERIFPFRSNEYYLSLIDWSDTEDPIRKIVIPDSRELDPIGGLDPSSEKNYTVMPGLQHKYPQTALILLSDVCGGICRFCFRKRLFLNKEREVAPDIPACLEYIRSHDEITNVLITGGDPLMLPTAHLEEVIQALRGIDHVQIIRIGSKLPAYNPHRILDDPELLEMFRKYSTPERRIYVMAQFNHPRELTAPAIKALDTLRDAGVVVVNQTPLIAGINDSPHILAELFRRLSFVGVSPYYVFQCRPTIGNRLFTVPLETSFRIVHEAFSLCSGLAKRARFIMSHATGKIEIVGCSEDRVFMRYHQAARKEDLGRFMIFPSNPDACWLDDYEEDTSMIRSSRRETLLHPDSESIVS